MTNHLMNENDARVRVSFNLARGLLSHEEEEKFIADLAGLLGASPEELSFVRQYEEPGKPEIGAIEEAGEHKGEIYGGIYPRDNKPIWFLEASNFFDHWRAAKWAKERGGSLPTMDQGNYLMTLQNKGAFTEIFNRSGSFPVGYIWLTEPSNIYASAARNQRLSDGVQRESDRDSYLQVLCVRR